jgi:hypothetical protein
VILASWFKVLQVRRKEAEFLQQLAEEMQRMKMLEKLIKDAAADRAALRSSQHQNMISCLDAQVIAASSRPPHRSFSA